MSDKLWRYGPGWLIGMAMLVAAFTWAPRHEQRAVADVRSGQEPPGSFRNVAADVLPSIVSIETTTKARTVENRRRGDFDDIPGPFRDLFQQDPRFKDLFKNSPQRQIPKQQGQGSGFIIDASGIIMTNHHVVAGSDEVKVRLYDGREFIAKDVKSDPRTDVAIVRIDAAGLKPLKLGDSNLIETGDWVLAVGSPFGLDMTVTAGIISAKGRGPGIAEREDFLQTDAAINPGNSGGPLINLKGEVIGINTAIETRSGGYDGIGFAVPMQIADWVGQQLIQNGTVRRGYLGIAIGPVGNELAKQLGVSALQGAVVREVRKASPAAKAGLEPGDVVMKLNQQQINNTHALQAVVERLEVGKSYPLEIIRETKPKTLQVTIDEMPAEYTNRRDRTQKSTPAEPSASELGLEVRPLTKDLAKQLNLEDVQGVVVVGVEEGSPAEAAGVRAGDVIERMGTKAVTTLDEFKAAAKEYSGADTVVLNLRTAEGKRFVILKLK